MDNFIPLRCPSCGGHIQVEKNLEKIFCSHCGTQLLLKQGADGLLTPMMARDLTASAKLKETQTTMMVIDLLKSQIKELEEQEVKIRGDFWKHVVHHLEDDGIFKESKVTRLINLYTQQATGKKVFDKNGLYRLCYLESGMFDIDKLVRYNLPSLSSSEDLIRLYQFIIQPKIYDQTAYKLAQVLHPITQIWPELQEKKQQLKKALDNLTSPGIQ